MNTYELSPARNLPRSIDYVGDEFRNSRFTKVHFLGGAATISNMSKRVLRPTELRATILGALGESDAQSAQALGLAQCKARDYKRTGRIFLGGKNTPNMAKLIFDHRIVQLEEPITDPEIVYPLKSVKQHLSAVARGESFEDIAARTMVAADQIKYPFRNVYDNIGISTFLRQSLPYNYASLTCSVN